MRRAWGGEVPQERKDIVLLPLQAPAVVVARVNLRRVAQHLDERGVAERQHAMAPGRPMLVVETK